MKSALAMTSWEGFSAACSAPPPSPSPIRQLTDPPSVAAATGRGGTKGGEGRNATAPAGIEKDLDNVLSIYVDFCCLDGMPVSKVLSKVL
jgi:hypothetical protein